MFFELHFNLIIDNSSLQDGFDTKYMSQVVVQSDGLVTWMPPALLQSSCEGKVLLLILSKMISSRHAIFSIRYTKVQAEIWLMVILEVPA